MKEPAMNTQVVRHILGLLACTLAAVSPLAHAQTGNYPSKPITIVVGYPRAAAPT